MIYGVKENTANIISNNLAKHFHIKIDITALVTINYKSSERNALFFL